MKVLVIGLGSMGRRRIRLLCKYDSDMEILGVDTNEQRRTFCEVEYSIKTYDSLVGLENIKCAFICTSPLSHSNLIKSCLNLNIHVFSELNLVSFGYNENLEIARAKDLILFISSTLLYRSEIKKIKSMAANANCLLNYSYHVGQYLPDWHPWESYKDFFVSNNKTNGCREIFAIEIPWLVDTFGEIAQISVVADTISSLDIAYKDNYLVLIKHKSGNKGMLAVDVVSRKAVRFLEVYGEKLYLNWDGSPKGLKVYDYDKKTYENIDLYAEIDQVDGYSDFIVENAYFDEIVSFFEAIAGNNVPVYNFENDMAVLGIIDKIEGLYEGTL